MKNEATLHDFFFIISIFGVLSLEKKKNHNFPVRAPFTPAFQTCDFSQKWPFREGFLRNPEILEILLKSQKVAKTVSFYVV